MGNIFQCCHTLSNYLKYQDALAQCGAEQSPLLSSEESDCDSMSLTCSLEDDLFSVSTGVMNLQPEHFLFPDIILSSDPGGEVTLVEPMVCLLVSEEEDGDVRANMEERGGVCSEVEHQREAETKIDAEVQAEVQTQTETHVTDEILDRDIVALRETEEERMKQERLLMEAQRDPQASKDKHTLRSGEQKQLNEFKEITISTNQISGKEQITEPSEVNFEENSAVWSEQHPALAHHCEKVTDQNTENTSETPTEHSPSSTNEKIAAEDSQNQTQQ